jgi:hypothetical protein
MKNIVPIVLIGLALVLVVGFLVLKKPTKPTVPAQISTEAPAEGETFVGKLKEAVMRGVPMKCTWKQGEYSGEGYIKGKQYFGEMRTPQAEGFVIMKNDCIWSWNKGETQGLKLCFEPTEEEEDFWEVENAPTGQYTCVPAAVTDSKFDPPANVNFLSMEEMMQQFGQ